MHLGLVAHPESTGKSAGGPNSPAGIPVLGDYGPVSVGRPADIVTRAGLGKSGQGWARQGLPKQGWARQGRAKQGWTRQGLAKQGLA